MTAPDPRTTRTGRIAGVALLGLALVALVMGLVTAFGDDGDNNADGDGQPTTTSSSRPATTGQPPSSRTSVIPPTSSTSTSEAPTTTTTTTPGQSQTPPPGGDGNGEPAKSVPVRVYNNSTVKGLAAKAADDLRADGWNVTEVGNYPYGIIRTTSVYYRPGTEEEAVARSIAATFGMRVAERFEGIRDAPAGVIVIVTNDYGSGGDGDKNEG